MGQIRQDDTRTELSRPGEPGLTTRMVEKCIQQQQNEIPLKEIASFSAVRFALPSIPWTVLHSLVISVSGCLYSVLAVQARCGLFCRGRRVITSSISAGTGSF